MSGTKEKFVKIRYSEEEKERIEVFAHDHGLDTSSFIRLAVTEAMKYGIKVGKSAAPKGQSLEVMSN